MWTGLITTHKYAKSCWQFSGHVKHVVELWGNVEAVDISMWECHCEQHFKLCSVISTILTEVLTRILIICLIGSHFLSSEWQFALVLSFVIVHTAAWVANLWNLMVSITKNKIIKQMFLINKTCNNLSPHTTTYRHKHTSCNIPTRNQHKLVRSLCIVRFHMNSSIDHTDTECAF